MSGAHRADAGEESDLVSSDISIIRYGSNFIAVNGHGDTVEMGGEINGGKRRRIRVENGRSGYSGDGRRRYYTD